MLRQEDIKFKAKPGQLLKLSKVKGGLQLSVVERGAPGSSPSTKQNHNRKQVCIFSVITTVKGCGPTLDERRGPKSSPTPLLLILSKPRMFLPTGLAPGFPAMSFCHPPMSVKTGNGPPPSLHSVSTALPEPCLVPCSPTTCSTSDHLSPSQMSRPINGIRKIVPVRGCH